MQQRDSRITELNLFGNNDLGNDVYETDTTIRELTLSGNSEIFLSDSTIPLLENQFKLFLTKEDFLGVESLTRAPSVGVISVTGLDNLSNLKRLSISYCPELCNWNDKTLPLSLQSLKLKSCDKLSSLPLLSVQNSLNTLNVLSIINCPRLALLDGFHGLMELQTVELLRCRNITISPATESLPAQPYYPHILIADCPLMRDWCQGNSIKYYELNPIANPQDDREDEVERSIREFLDKI